jgi:arylsulfatase A-like enzyme
MNEPTLQQKTCGLMKNLKTTASKLLMSMPVAMVCGVCACVSSSSNTVVNEERVQHQKPLLENTLKHAQSLVLITVDTLRYDQVGAFQTHKALTPNIDSLSAFGVSFSSAFAQSTTTTPSHASLFTGVYLRDHKVFSNFEALADAPRTWAEIFAGRGFQTFAVVNMAHLNPEVSNLAQGFQTFKACEHVRKAHETVDVFLDWLDTARPQKFFAWIHLVDVHTPYNPPAPYDYLYYHDDKSTGRKTSLARIWPLLPDHVSDHPFFKEWLSGVTDVEWVLAQYRGAVSYVDDEIGRLQQALAERGKTQDVAWVLTSDHGESLGEHGMYFVHTGLYEPTVHVPLIMVFPGEPLKGRVVSDVVELVDVMPTVLDYFQLPVPAQVKGRSLWGMMRGQLQPPKVAWIDHAGRSLVAVRSKRYKYIKHLKDEQYQPSYPFIKGREELYDVYADPYEKHNLAQERPDVLEVLRKQAHTNIHMKPMYQAGQAHVSEETAEMLRSLGYVR